MSKINNLLAPFRICSIVTMKSYSETARVLHIPTSFTLLKGRTKKKKQLHSFFQQNELDITFTYTRAGHVSIKYNISDVVQGLPTLKN